MIEVPTRETEEAATKAAEAAPKAPEAPKTKATTRAEALRGSVLEAERGLILIVSGRRQ